MNHFIILVSFIASVFTIGDTVHKILTGQEYNLFAGIILVFVIVAVQLSFQVLMEIKADAKDKYVPILFFLFIPIVIISATWGYYNQAISPEANFEHAILESIKIATLIIITVFLFLYWATMFELNFYKKPPYLGVAYGVPAMLMLGTIVYHYTFTNNVLDPFFGGFLFLLLVTVLSAAITKSRPINKIFIRLSSKFPKKSSNDLIEQDNETTPKSIIPNGLNDNAVLITLSVTALCFILFLNGQIFGGIFLPVLSFLAFRFKSLFQIFDKIVKDFTD